MAQNTSERVYTLYGLYDDTKLRYIGVTGFPLSRRLKQHLQDKDMCHRVKWIKLMQRREKDVLIRPIAENLNREQAMAMEIKFIAHLKESGVNITNELLGGDLGMTGRKHSEETKRKMSESRRGSQNAFFGKTHSPETRERMKKKLKGRSVWSKGVKFTDQHKQRLSAGQRGKPKNRKSKFDLELVRSLYNDGLSQASIGQKLNIDRGTVSRIINRKRGYR